MGGGDIGGSVVLGAALAESGAGATDLSGGDGNGVAVCAGAEYFAAGAGAGRFGGAGVVGVSAGVAPLDESGAGVLDVSPVVVIKDARYADRRTGLGRQTNPV